MSQQELKIRATRRTRAARLALEVSAYTLGVVVTVLSAQAAKRAQLGPALAAVDFAPAPAGVELVAAAPEAAPVPVAPAPLIEVESGALRPEAGALRYFDGRPVRPVRTVWMTVTGYSPDERSCGKWADGITASGKSVWTNGMRLVAADTRLLPFGSLLSVPGYAEGEVVPVLDRGGAIKGARLDLLYATHEEALVWGVQRVPVTIWEYADGEE